VKSYWFGLLLLIYNSIARYEIIFLCRVVMQFFVEVCRFFFGRNC